MSTTSELNINGYVALPNGTVFSRKSNKYIKPRNHSGGYLQMTLWYKGTQKDMFVHRIIAKEFIPNPNKKPCVNHIDGDKTNNNLYNLEWVTDSENQKHAYKLGLNSRKGTNNGMSKLDWEKVKCIRESLLNGETGVSLSKKYGVSEVSIRQIKYNRSWIV